MKLFVTGSGGGQRPPPPAAPPDDTTGKFAPKSKPKKPKKK